LSDVGAPKHREAGGSLATLPLSTGLLLEISDDG